MPNISAGSQVTFTVTAAGTLTVTPGASGYVRLSARGASGSQTIAPRVVYAATGIAATVGDVVTLSAHVTDAAYTDPASVSGAGIDAATLASPSLSQLAPGTQRSLLRAPDGSFVLSDATDTVPGAGLYQIGRSSQIQVPNIKSARGVWVYKSAATTTPMVGAWYVYTPVKSGEYYNYAIFGNNFSHPAAAISWTMGRFGLAVLGSYIRHDSGSATKTGTWTTVSLDFAFQSTYARADVAGDKITMSVTGHSLVLRTIGINPGGYAIVGIDGDYTNAANCLPVFTAADFTAGLCRSTDVGKRYVNCYSLTTIGDYHIPLAQGLADTAHTLVMECTGTKPTASSAGSRLYVAGVVASSAANAGQSPSATVAFGHIEAVYDFISGPAAFSVVMEAEKPTALGTYEFLIGTHGGETDTAFRVIANEVDITGTLAAGAYSNAAAVRVESESTIANTDAPGTPFMAKNQVFFFSGRGRAPMMCTTKFTFTVARRIRSHYPLMMTMHQINRGTVAGTPANYNTRWTQFRFGGFESVPANLTKDNANYGKVECELALASSPLHPHTAFAALLDGYESVAYFQRAPEDAVFVQSRADGSEKFYFQRSSINSQERFAVGDVLTSRVGWGVVPGAFA